MSNPQQNGSARPAAFTVDGHIPLNMDRRIFPTELASQLHAQYASDLACLDEQPFKPVQDLVNKAFEDSRAYTANAILELEEASDLLDALFEEYARMGKLPLECQGAAQRALLPLAKLAPSAQFVTVPLTAYNVYAGLSDLYARTGDFQKAMDAVNRCIEVAPIEPAAYMMKSFVYARMQKIDEAMTLMKMALEVCLDPSERSLILCHLANYYWSIDNMPVACALFTVVVDGGERGTCFAQRHLFCAEQHFGKDVLPTSTDEAYLAAELEDIPTDIAPAAKKSLVTAADEFYAAGMMDFATECQNAIDQAKSKRAMHMDAPTGTAQRNADHRETEA